MSVPNPSVSVSTPVKLASEIAVPPGRDACGRLACGVPEGPGTSLPRKSAAR
jgi:hypothetical protein